MTPKEIMLTAFEGGKPERIPVTLFGGGMWSIHNWGATFEELATDAEKMTQMLIDMSEKLRCDIVYAGSGYNNFHTAALGGRIKFREMGAPDLEDPIISSEEDLAKKGIEAQSPHPKSLAEEAPGAYKNVDDVIDSVHGAGISLKAVRMVPVGVIKG